MSDTQNRLFRDEDFEEVKTTSQKVVCLGKEFPSDEARREYFRDELRKKLPELRNIEGFPIGADEDIINLSDPPYYTACPNPWLNDFINEWEKEKIQLEKRGVRTPNFDVKRPYASDVSVGKNNPIYMAHAYHTKVPHPAIMRYILHYTQPGDVVFDGFCGTGMTGVAAQLCGSFTDVNKIPFEDGSLPNVGTRHAICSDLSPIASLIAASYNTKFDINAFERKANSILDEVEKELGWMYTTEVNGYKAKINYTIWSYVFSCPNCGKEIVYWDSAVSKDTKVIKDSFPCPYCGTNCSKSTLEKTWENVYDSVLGSTTKCIKKVPTKINYSYNSHRGEKDISTDDLDLLKKISEISLSSFMVQPLPSGDKTSDPFNVGVKYIHQFFTLRNLITLSRIYDKVKNDVFLTTWFTSSLQNSSIMYKFRTDRKGGILNGTLFTPSLFIEQCPINILRRKIKDFVSTDYAYRGNSNISVNSATKISNLKNNSIDYIFTDPPFGANIMYSELSLIWESWLKVLTNNTEEAIINKSQNKSISEYQNLMINSLKEFYRVLKPGKWLTMEFSNTSASVWNCIQNALQNVGFIIANVAALDKKQGSFNAVTSTTAVKQDLVITCFKPSGQLSFNFESSENKKLNVMEFIEELLIHLPVHIEKQNLTTAVIERSPKILYDRLISYYVQHGYPIPMDASEFHMKLKDSFVEIDGMYFTASQAVEYEEKKKSTKGVEPMTLFISNEAEGIEWLKRELAVPRYYHEIQPKWLKDLVPVKKGDILPELSEILEENFIKDENGKWRKPDAEKAADLEIIRNRRLIREFNIYLEQAQKPKSKIIKDTRLEVLRYGFKECYKNKEFKSIVTVGDHIREELLQEDEVLLQYYDIASMKV